FQLVPALQFAALLGVVMFAAEALGHWLGQAGLYALSLFTGLADVDAIVLSLAPKAGTELGPGVVVRFVAVAAAPNTVIKGACRRFVAGRALGWRGLVPAVASALTVVLAALAPVMA